MICDIHNEIIEIFNEAGKKLMKNKEHLVDDKIINAYVLAIKSIATTDGLIWKANQQALYMEECLRLRKIMMEKAGIEEAYKAKKKKMQEGGFMNGDTSIL